MTTKYIYFEEYEGVPTFNESVFVFDIDYTLYPFSVPINEIMQENLKKYIHKKNESLDFEKLTEEYNKKYGLHYKGFLLEGHLDRDDYIKHITELDFDGILTDEKELSMIISQIPSKKICFTNSSIFHSSLILKSLNIEHLFDYVLCPDYFSKSIYCKPMPDVYQIVENLSGVKDKRNIHFFDDSMKNISIAQSRGWTCYHVTLENPLNVHLASILKQNKEMNELCE